MTTRNKLRLINLLVGLYNLYLWHIGGALFLFTLGCLNIPYPLGEGDTLMVRTMGYEFCPPYCGADHFHVGHKRNYNCETEICDHMIYEDRLN